MAEPKSLDQIRGEYKQWIKKASTEFGLNPNVVLSLIAHESRGDQYAIGGAGEWGLTQLMPDTARGIADSLGVKYDSQEDLKKMLLEKPGLNIAFGAKYYSDQLKRANGDHVMAYSMYNAGPAYNKNRPDVWSKISAGDMSGTDQISTNANNFLSKMLETGYDQASRSWPGYDAASPAGWEVPDFASSMDSYGKFRDGITPDGGAAQGDLVGSESALQPDTRYNPKSRAELNAEDWWNPVARGYGGLTKGLTAGYVNPMEGMEQYVEPGTINERIGRWSELTGEGVGIAAPFAVGSGVAGLAGRGLTAAIPGLARAGAIAPVAKSAASMALYEAATKGAGATEQGTPLYAEDAPLQDKVIAQLRERAPEAIRGLGVGAALGAFHMVPGVRQLAERPWGKPIVTAGALTGLASGEQAMHGDPVTWGANLENAIPMSIGMTMGNALAENVTRGMGRAPKAEKAAPEKRFITEADRQTAKEMGLHGDKWLESVAKERAAEAKLTTVDRPLESGEPVSAGDSPHPVVNIMNRARRGEISLEDVVATFKTNPDLFKVAPAAEALVKDLAARQQAGEVNLPEGRSAFRDRRRFVREATGGEAENPAYREMIRVGETTEMFKEWMKGELDSRMLNALGEVKSQPDSEALGRFLDKWKRDVPAEVFAQTEDGMKALSGARNPESVVRAAAPVAKELGFQRGIRNDVREMFAKEGKGGDPAFEEMGNIESYFPHTEKRIGFFKNPKVWLEQSTRPIKQGEQRPSKRVYSSHERQRKGMLTEDKIDWSTLDVIGKYNADTARVLSNSIALNAGENLAQVYRDAGLKGTADGLSLVNQQSYGGKMSPISKFYGASRGGVAAMNTALAMKQAFNSATYAFNIPFMALRQWTSVGLTAAHGEITPKDVGWAIANMNSAKIRGEFKDSYTGWIKNRGRGSLTRQGSLRTDFLNEKLGGKSGFVDFMRELPNAPVSGMENVTGRFAFALAERIGMKAGLKGEMLDGFKSDVAGLTQSYYDSLNRAPILNDPFLNLLFPAQGYSVEVANTYRSAARGETGAQRGRASGTQRAARVFNLAMTTYLLNLAYTYMVGYKGDERGVEALADPELHLDNAFSVATGSIPYLPSVLGMGPSKGMTMPSQRMKEFEKAVGQMSDGDWELALAEISKKQVPAGGAMNRIIQAQKMYDDGKITEDDLITAMILGWYTTESGKDYLQKVSRQGVVKDILLGEEESGSKPSTSRRAPTAKRPTRRSKPGR